MNIEVRYQSRGGNTKKVAEIIASELGKEAKSIDIPLDKHVDILFLRGGVYNWTADSELIKFIKHLDRNKVGKIIPFSTTGSFRSAINKINECASEQDIPVSEDYLCIKMMLKGNALIGKNGGVLSEGQEEEVREFVRKIMGR